MGISAICLDIVDYYIS